jgi:hypothetical protein
MSKSRHVAWRKSSYSDGTGNCVEVASASWRKSSYSSGTGNCAEVASADRFVAVRDTKQGRRGPLLKFAEDTWRRFLTETKSGKAVR